MGGATLNNHRALPDCFLVAIIQVKLNLSIQDDPKIDTLGSVNNVQIIVLDTSRWKVNDTTYHAVWIGNADGFPMPIDERFVHSGGYTFGLADRCDAVSLARLWLTIARIQGSEILVPFEDRSSIRVMTCVLDQNHAAVCCHWNLGH